MKNYISVIVIITILSSAAIIKAEISDNESTSAKQSPENRISKAMIKEEIEAWENLIWLSGGLSGNKVPPLSKAEMDALYASLMKEKRGTILSVLWDVAISAHRDERINLLAKEKVEDTNYILRKDALQYLLIHNPQLSSAYVEKYINDDDPYLQFIVGAYLYFYGDREKGINMVRRLYNLRHPKMKSHQVYEDMLWILMDYEKGQ